MLDGGGEGGEVALQMSRVLKVRKEFCAGLEAGKDSFPGAARAGGYLCVRFVEATGYRAVIAQPTGGAEQATVAHEARHGFAIHHFRDQLENRFVGRAVNFDAPEKDGRLEGVVLRARHDGLGKMHPVLGGAMGDFREVGVDPAFESGVGDVLIAVGDDGLGLEQGAAGEEGIAELFGGAAALGGDEAMDEFSVGFEFFGEEFGEEVGFHKDDEWRVAR